MGDRLKRGGEVIVGAGFGEMRVLWGSWNGRLVTGGHVSVGLVSGGQENGGQESDGHESGGQNSGG